MDQYALVEETLSAPERAALAEQEAIVARGLRTFYDVGNALAQIRDGRLYRATHPTFAAYCRERWGVLSRTAYDLIGAAGVVDDVQDPARIGPANVEQTRPLLTLDADERRLAWAQAVETAPNGRVTGAHVARTVERLAASPLAVHFSSETPEWYTPRPIIDAVLAFFDEIDLDPCSNDHAAPNVPARQHFTAADDGLAQPWWGRVYLNPPYGREIGRWVTRLTGAYRDREIEAGIALLPARTDTEWFDALADCAICFIRGRLTFVGADSAAPFPSMLAYTGDEWERFAADFASLGKVWRRMGR